MKQICLFLLVCLFFITTKTSAQSLAINTDGSTANASALLDVKSTAKGILVPRMSRTERNAIAAPATGLLIFQNGPDSIGFHYYDGTKWTWLLSNSNADSLAWRTNGNTGTNPANHFLGTTDNVPLVLKINNSEKLRVTTAGELGIGTITPNSTYGYAKVEIASEGYLAPTDLLIRNAVNNAGYAPGLLFQHARGTLATPVAVNNGDYLSAISTMNYDGSNYISSAGLDIYADGAIATGIVPTKLQFNTMNTVGNYATRLTIKNDGKTGIGTTTPSAKLHVGGGTRFTVLDTGSIFLQSGNTIGSARDWKIAVTLPNGYLSFRDMGFDNTGTGAMATDAMVIAWGTGNVGIGTPTPNSTLSVNGTLGIGTSLNIAGGPGGTPVSLLNQKSYVGVLPANATDNFYQLPDPTIYPGRMYIIRNNSSVDQANITTAAGLLFAGNSSVGGATYTLNPTTSPKTVMAISDGANWTIMVQN